MAELAVGVVFAVPTLIRQVSELYDRCRSSADFRHLGQEVKAFHDALVLTAQYLVHLKDIREACEQLVVEIGDVVSKSAKWVRRMAMGSEPIHSLMIRLISQKTTLILFSNLLRERGLDRNIAASAESSQSLQTVYVYYDEARKQAALISPAVGLKPNTRRSVSTCSSSDADSGFSSLYPTTSLNSIDSASSWEESKDGFSTVSTRKFDDAIDLAACNTLIEISKTPVPQFDHAEHIRRLLHDDGASFACRDTEHLRTPLIWAVVAGRDDLVDLYLREKVDTDAADGLSGWTPAMHAVMWQRFDILGALIGFRADLTAVDYEGSTALLLAVKYGMFEAVELILGSDKGLVQAWDEDRMSPLSLACSKGFFEIAKLCAEAGDNANFRFTSGHSLLESAILARDERTACLLLDNGAVAQSLGVGSVSLLVLALQLELQDTAKILIEKGADVNSIDESGDSALAIAVQGHLSEIADMLVSKGATLQCPKTQVPVLTRAVKEQQHDIVQLLIRNEADLEVMDPDGYVALLWAVWYSDVRMVKLLIDNGAKVGEETGAVKAWAMQMGNEDIIRLVLSPHQ